MVPIKRIAVGISVVGALTGIVLLLDLFLPLWLAIILGVFVVSILAVYALALCLYMAYPVLIFLGLILWGLHTEGKRK